MGYIRVMNTRNSNEISQKRPARTMGGGYKQGHGGYIGGHGFGVLVFVRGLVFGRQH